VNCRRVGVAVWLPPIERIGNPWQRLTMEHDEVEALARVQAEIIKCRRQAAETPNPALRNALLLLAQAAEQRAREFDRLER
jgi:hypothetical protein